MHFGRPHRRFGISPPVWVKNKRKSKLKNRMYYWAELKQNSQKKPNLLSQVATTTFKMIYPFRHSVAVSKPIVAFLLVFNFCRLYILFCIKDIPTACSPLGDLSAHTRKKKTYDLWKLRNIQEDLKTSLNYSLVPSLTT